MIIAFRGNFAPRTSRGEPFSTESHVAATMELMGYEVVRLQEDSTSWEETVRAARGADLFWWTSTYGMAELWPKEAARAGLRQLKAVVPTVSHHLDLYLGLDREHLLSDPFWRTDFVFTADGDPGHSEVIRSRGIRHWWIRPGVYGPECYRAEPRDEFEADVAFVGSWAEYHPEWGYRTELASFLRKAWGDRARLWPPYGEPAIRGSDLNALYASTKVVVGDSCNPGFSLRNYWSDRVPETLGRGGFLVHPRVGGLEEEVKEGEHLAVYDYGDWDELYEVVNYYLREEEERERIRTEGHEHAKATMTYERRLEEIFGILRSEGAIA